MAMGKTNRLRVSGSWAGLGLALGLATAASAQDVAGSALPAHAVPASGATGGDIIVTAQHRSENIQSVPISIQALSGAAVANLGVKSTTDIGKVAAAVNIVLPAGQGNQPVITIRGIGINDNNSNNAGSAGVYVDEFYLSAPTSQTLSLFDLDRVEVLKGPQGTLYGRNTSIGAINIITAKPTDQFGGYFRGTIGNYDSYSAEGAVGGQIVDGIDGRFSFDRNFSKGFFHNLYTGTRSNGANDFELRGQLLFKPASNLKILVASSYAHVNRRPDEYRHLGGFVPGTEGPGGAGEICAPADILARNGCVDLFGAQSAKGQYQVYGNRTEHLRVTDFGQTARIEWSPGSVNIVALSQYHFNKRFLPEDTDANQYRLLEVNYFNKSREYTQELRVSQSSNRYNWVAGAYFLHEDLRQNQNLNALLDYDKFFGPGSGDLANNGNDVTQLIPYRYFGDNKQITDAYAAFGQGEYKITDRLKFILGGRYTKEVRSFHYDSEAQYQVGGIDHFGPLQPIIDTTRHLNNQAFNYRVGLNYTPRQDFMLYATVASGFKSGDFNGGFLSNDSATAAAQVNPVKPEKVTTYEVGLKSRFLDRKLTFNLSLYYNDYRDLQLFAFLNEQVGSSIQVVNTLASAKKARTYGADIEIDAHPIHNLSLGAQIGLLNSKLVKYTGVDPELFEGRQLVFAPRISAFLTADYRIPMGDNALTLSANASFKSKQQLTSTADPIYAGFSQQSAYWLEGARVAYDIKNLELAGFVANLSNKHYTSTSFNAIEPFGFLELVVGEPRTYGIEAKITF
jgi:iron complex outermembrane receptor protein